MRMVAIRRPGRRPPTRRWRWFMAWSTPGDLALVGGEVSDPREYLELALDGSDGTPVEGPLIAVCAHGRHDQCCAVRGRKATAAVAAAHPDSTWECSHVGGDRFAANMIILPEGMSYGRVDLTDAAAIVDRHIAGRVSDTFLRGRSSMPHAVQAAQHFARVDSGDDRIDAYPPIAVRRRDHHIEVTLADPGGGTVRVDLGEHLSDPLISNCRATVAGRVRMFALLALDIA